ncbi:hypothetical protein BDQ17DRAFT_1319926 [Cyathus striatus]|nr:hypothetical protein BDQ17DRAFT_1319926 [Cyathus striatus]
MGVYEGVGRSGDLAFAWVMGACRPKILYPASIEFYTFLRDPHPAIQEFGTDMLTLGECGTEDKKTVEQYADKLEKPPRRRSPPNGGSRLGVAIPADGKKSAYGRKLLEPQYEIEREEEKGFLIPNGVKEHYREKIYEFHRCLVATEKMDDGTPTGCPGLMDTTMVKYEEAWGGGG